MEHDSERVDVGRVPGLVALHTPGGREASVPPRGPDVAEAIAAGRIPPRTSTIWASRIRDWRTASCRDCRRSRSRRRSPCRGRPPLRRTRGGEEAPPHLSFELAGDRSANPARRRALGGGDLELLTRGIFGATGAPRALNGCTVQTTEKPPAPRSARGGGSGGRSGPHEAPCLYQGVCGGAVALKLARWAARSNMHLETRAVQPV